MVSEHALSKERALTEKVCHLVVDSNKLNRTVICGNTSHWRLYHALRATAAIDDGTNGSHVVTTRTTSAQGSSKRSGNSRAISQGNLSCAKF